MSKKKATKSTHPPIVFFVGQLQVEVLNAAQWETHLPRRTRLGRGEEPKGCPFGVSAALDGSRLFIEWDDQSHPTLSVTLKGIVSAMINAGPEEIRV